MKGVSSIVVMVLILLIAMSLSTMLYIYMTNTQQQITGGIEKQQEIELRKASSEMRILGSDPASGNITIRNTGRYEITSFSLFLNDMQTEIRPLQKLSPGETGTISPVSKPAPGSYRIKITGSYATTESFMTMPGGPNPMWSLLNENVTVGTDVKLYAYWTDDVMLSYAILSTNETGSWNNKTIYGSPLSLGAQASWSNFSWKNSSTQDDTIVAWKIYANDSDGHWNTTNTMTFKKGTPSALGPRWSSLQENATEGTDIKLSSYWADDTALSYAILSTNETGSWNNKTTYGSPMSMTGTGNWSNFSWSNASIQDGTNISWKIYANNSGSKWNVTDIVTFEYKQPTMLTPNPKWFGPYLSSYVAYANWTDSETSVDYTWLSTDETGPWQNYTAREASFVIDDMFDNVSWAKGLPWRSSSSPVMYMRNTTNGYIRDGSEILITFIYTAGTPGSCLNGTTSVTLGNDVVGPNLNLNLYEKIAYWAQTDYNPQQHQNQNEDPTIMKTSISTINALGVVCNHTTNKTVFNAWTFEDFSTAPQFWMKNGTSQQCSSKDISNVRYISIYFMPEIEGSRTCYGLNVVFGLDELYLLKTMPADYVFKTMFTWKNNSIAAGTNVQWKIYANDTQGYENVTSEGTINAP